MRRYIIFIPIIALTLIFSFCAVLYIHLHYNEISASSPSDYPMQQASTLMQAIALHTTGPMPTSLPINGYLSQGCWDILQTAMAKNNHQYTLVVAGIYGDGGTLVPGGTGSDVVLIDVAFPDGTSVELNFYASTLNMCQLN
jgi:hypothetical protein